MGPADAKRPGTGPGPPSPASSRLPDLVDEGSNMTVTNMNDDRYLDDNGFKYEETQNVIRVTITPQN